jgi:glycerate kinase
MLVCPERRDPKTTTTFGIGELLLAAIDRGAREIILGIGGSATNDGGSGMAEALGVRFLDRSGTPLKRGGAALLNLDKIDVGGMDSRIFRTKITAACDVSNPLTGSRGASAVYGPQKGASKEDVALLDRALRNYGDVIRTSFGIDLQEIPGSGAAGGLGAGLVAFCHGILKPGIDVVLEATRFEEKVMRADLVLTGEGKLDSQTRFGKTLSGVMRCATAHGKPLVAVVGMVEGDKEEFLGPDGLYSLASLVDPATSAAMAMENAERLIRKRTADLLHSILEE